MTYNFPLNTAVPPHFCHLGTKKQDVNNVLPVVFIVFSAVKQAYHSPSAPETSST